MHEIPGKHGESARLRDNCWVTFIYCEAREAILHASDWSAVMRSGLWLAESLMTEWGPVTAQRAVTSCFHLAGASNVNSLDNSLNNNFANVLNTSNDFDIHYGPSDTVSISCHHIFFKILSRMTCGGRGGRLVVWWCPRPGPWADINPGPEVWGHSCQHSQRGWTQSITEHYWALSTKSVCDREAWVWERRGKNFV